MEGLRVARPGGGHPRTRPDRLGGDKAYSSRRNPLPAQTPHPNFRAVATRYDKRVYVFHGTVAANRLRLRP
ncbi:hypothetical protein GCM10018966_055760 [Streptomyces yanii]